MKLAITDEEARAITRPDVLPLRRDVVRLEIGGFLDERPYALLGIRADSANSARIEVQHLIGEMLRQVGLDARQADVVWVAPMTETDGDDLRFLEQARELVEEERYEMAVLAAQTHFERQVGTLVALAIQGKPDPLVAALVDKQRSWSLMRPLDRAIVEAALNVSFKRRICGRAT